MKYFIIDQGQQQGSFTIYELKDRNLASDTLVWAEGMAEWTPAWQVKELHDFLYGTTPDSATPPPVPPQSAAHVDEPTAPTAPIAPTNPQPQQQAYQQQAYQQPVRRSSHWKAWFGFLLVLVLIIAAMSLTCPQRYAHRHAIRTMVENNTRKDFTTGNQLLDAAMKMMMSATGGDELIDETLNSMLRYHNYVLFSTTTFHDQGEDIRASIGLFGHVFTQHEDELLEKIGSQPTIQIQQSSSSSQDEAEPDDSEDQQSDADTSTQADDKDADKVLDAVGNVVKKKVQENTDSTSSEGIGKLIDSILDLIKGS